MQRMWKLGSTENDIFLCISVYLFCDNGQGRREWKNKGSRPIEVDFEFELSGFKLKSESSLWNQLPKLGGQLPSCRPQVIPRLWNMLLSHKILVLLLYSLDKQKPNTVFPQIVSTFFFLNLDVSSQYIKVRKLFQGRNFLRKYGT